MAWAPFRAIIPLKFFQKGNYPMKKTVSLIASCHENLIYVEALGTGSTTEHPLCVSVCYLYYFIQVITGHQKEQNGERARKTQL